MTKSSPVVKLAACPVERMVTLPFSSAGMESGLTTINAGEVAPERPDVEALRV
jgi:hypothetical protein